MLVTVEVTQKDIDNGKICCASCPISLALKRIFPNKPDIATMFTRFYLDIFSNTSYLLPETAIDFRENFDAKNPVSPFSFTFEYEGDINETTN